VLPAAGFCNVRPSRFCVALDTARAPPAATGRALIRYISSVAMMISFGYRGGFGASRTEFSQPLSFIAGQV